MEICDNIPAPISILFSWNSTNCLQEVKDLEQKLNLTSETSIKDWEISISMKRTKTSADSQQMVVGYLFKFLDYGSTCYVPSYDSLSSSNMKIIIGSEHLESVLTTSGNLTNRSLWKVTGKSFRIDKFVVSIGLIEHNVNIQPVLEIMCVDETIADFEDVYNSILSLSDIIISRSNTISSFCSPSKFIELQTNISTYHIFRERCSQWLTLIQST